MSSRSLLKQAEDAMGLSRQLEVDDDDDSDLDDMSRWVPMRKENEDPVNWVWGVRMVVYYPERWNRIDWRG